MAKCSVLILLAMSVSVFARDCDRVLSSKSGDNYCDECIRCGARWCNDIDMEYQHCRMVAPADNWCPRKQETVAKINNFSKAGRMFEYEYFKTMAYVGKSRIEEIEIRGLLPEPDEKVYVNVVSPAHFKNDDQSIKGEVKENYLVVTAVIRSDFCSPNSTTSESISVRVGLLGHPGEEVTLEYVVPCACGCSQRVEKNSSECSYKGDLSCGVCHCVEGRKGSRCERKKCIDRGDNPLTCYSASKPHEVCSGNGRCDEDCNVCECFDDASRAGSQYFDPETHCEDICSMTSKCVDCLKNPEPGLCDCEFAPSVIIQNLDQSRLNETEQGRRVWVQCNATLPDCGLVRYAAMKKDGVHLMVFSSCEATDGYLAAGGQPIMVPVGVAVALVALAVAAAGAYMAYQSRLPALQPTAPQYANIGGEDSVGVNPLYVDPTSSFKNPMYGKGA